MYRKQVNQGTDDHNNQRHNLHERGIRLAQAPKLQQAETDEARQHPINNLSRLVD